MAAAETYVLFHLATDLDGNPKDAVLVDGNGKKHLVPYNEPTEVENWLIAEKIMEHCFYCGVVRVHTIRTKTGIVFDLEDAEGRAKIALEKAEEECWRAYVRSQLEDRIQKNYPPLPPIGWQLDVVVKHKIDLRRWGIHPVGWTPPYDVPEDFRLEGGAKTPPPPERDQVKQLTKEIDALKNMVRDLQQLAAVSRTATPMQKGQRPFEPETIQSEAQGTEQSSSI